MIYRLIIRHSERKLLCSHLEGHNEMEHTYPVIDYCGIFGYSQRLSRQAAPSWNAIQPLCPPTYSFCNVLNPEHSRIKENSI